MARDDDELAQEIRASEDEAADGATGAGAAGADATGAAPAAKVASPGKASARTPVPAWLKIGAVFVVLGVGVAVLLWGTEASDAFVYSKLVDEVLADPDRYRGRELRVEGQLQQGSIVFEAEPSCEHRFVLARSGRTLPVRFPRCVVPDTFRDDMAMDVVVQGQLQPDDTFLANEVIPRCPSKYEMRQRQESGEEMPHSAPPARQQT
ncbi:MAG: cytochrome c maturation protein CcmE [Sandaracinaceae bacterium]|nr:cytochrome c maturation protein CcmE [Sandaracinaceae bacterium]